MKFPSSHALLRGARRSKAVLVRLRSRLPALAPAEKAALAAIVAVLSAGALLRAWERAGVSLGPVDDWESLRTLIVQSREELTREGGGGYPCAIDDIPGNFADRGRAGENVLAAGAGFARAKPAKPEGDRKSGGSGKKAGPPRPVDLNAASEKTLLSLPGVGPSTAKAIVAQRAAQGRFRSVDELLRVKGIGPKKLEALRPYLRVEAQEAAPADSAPR